MTGDASATVPGLRTNHSVQLTGLNSETTYTISVASSDGSGNGPTVGGPVTFTTAATPDTNAPVVREGPIVTAITDNSAVVEWMTSEPVITRLDYGPTMALGTSLSDEALRETHRVTLSGLSGSTEYFLSVAGADAAGNPMGPGRVIGFLTLATPDTAAPVIVDGAAGHRHHRHLGDHRLAHR